MTDALPSAINAWRRQFSTSKRWELALTSRTRSCALLSLSVNGHHDSLDVCVRELAELLRLVELMKRPGVPRALHVLTVGSDKCPVGQNRCAYCDDVDSRVVVALRPTLSGWSRDALQSFPAIVRGALFEWNEETMASPAFLHLRDILLTRASASATTTRSRPVELSIDIDGVEEQFEDLQSLLHQLRDSAATLEGFRLESLSALEWSQRAADLLAACHLPIRAICDWQKLGFDEKGDVRLLNMTTLSGDAPNSERAIELLYQLVHAHASQLKTLRLWHRSIHGQQLRETEVQTIGRSLFAPDSPLSLDNLCFLAPIGESDLQLMLAPLGSTVVASTHRNNAAEARHRVFELKAFRLSTIQGATLGRLLTTSGGVESLALFTPASEGLSIAQIPPLLRSCPSLRSLTFHVSCIDWESIGEDKFDASISIVSLELRIHDDARTVMVVSAIDRLLSVVGPSLESLGLQPGHRYHTTFSADLVAVVARRCPKLQELRVHRIDECFLSTLVELYGTIAFRPKRLELLTDAARVDVFDFLTVMRTPTHPMAQVLRSLRIEVDGYSMEDADALRRLLKRVLNENSKLRDVTSSTNLVTSPYDIQNDEEVDRRSRCASRLPPLRHRLAALSALRHLPVPVDILTDILTLAGRPIPRL